MRRVPIAEVRERVMKAARRHEIDICPSLTAGPVGPRLALIVTLKVLAELGIGSVWLMEALDLTTPTGRKMAGLLSVFSEFEHQIPRFHGDFLILDLRGLPS